MTDSMLQNDVEYYIQYQESADVGTDGWYRLPPLPPYTSYTTAYQKMQNVLRDKYPNAKFRIECVVTQRIIMWSMEDEPDLTVHEHRASCHGVIGEILCGE